LKNEDILRTLTKIGRKDRFLSSYLPGSSHQLDFYFLDKDDVDTENLVKYDSLFDVIDGVWIKKPQKIMNALSSVYLLNKAKEKAKFFIDKIDLDLSQTKRDCIDFLILKDYIKSLDIDTIKEIKKEFQNIVNTLNNDLDILIDDKEMIKSLRKNSFNKYELDTELEKLMGSLNYSDGNLIFKVIQRYGYLRILSEISEIFKSKNINTDDDVEQLIGIIDNA
jgi:hypothetical protein